MNRSDIIVPIGSPLGLYQHQGRIQNGNRLLTLDEGSYVLWFYGHLVMDVGQWVGLSMEKGVLSDERECLSRLRELEEKGLWVCLKEEEPKAFLEAVQDCVATRQGIYYQENNRDLTFAIDSERLKIPNISLIKLIWMDADGHTSLPELIRRHDHEGISEKRESLASILKILLKFRLILLEANP